VANRDPARPPRHWAPEAWRLRCAVYDAMVRLPYASADARLLDGYEKWLGWRGKGQPVPGPWWALACALASAVWGGLEDTVSARLVAPWGRHGATVPGADAGPGEFRPLGG
jgi:hypothetical protein